MKDFIFNIPHEGNTVTILLYGSPVVGKSALARYLVHELSSVYNGAHYTINMKGMYSEKKAWHVLMRLQVSQLLIFLSWRR